MEVSREADLLVLVLGQRDLRFGLGDVDLPTFSIHLGARGVRVLAVSGPMFIECPFVRAVVKERWANF